ncbi:MAG: GGDEF domain-containing protein [Lachnospiraceae bacterium]|nr:GGDEF domain-containing protein [Lachnospiraceae bacterium]
MMAGGKKRGDKAAYNGSILLNRTWDEIYARNRGEIAKANLKFCYFISMIFMGVLVFFSIFAVMIRDTHLVPYYITTIVLLLLVFLLARNGLKDEEMGTRWHRLITYSFAAIMFLFSAYIIHFGNANILSYVALLVVLPILIIDTPTQKFLMVLAAAALFFVICITSGWDVNLQEEYDININLLGLAAFFCGVHNCWGRVQAIDLTRRLNEVSSEDVGTGLLNRRRLFLDLKELDEKSEIAGILMCDIDGFKKFNDTYGHQIGDKCIETVGKVLMFYGKETNIRFYRYGGDEFTGVMLTGGKMPIETAARDIAQMVNAVDIRVPSGETINITISVGYSLLQNGIDYNECLKYADYKMYQVKQQMLMRRMAQLHYDIKEKSEGLSQKGSSQSK